MTGLEVYLGVEKLYNKVILLEYVIPGHAVTRDLSNNKGECFLRLPRCPHVVCRPAMTVVISGGHCEESVARRGNLKVNGMLVTWLTIELSKNALYHLINDQ